MFAPRSVKTVSSEKTEKRQRLKQFLQYRRNASGGSLKQPLAQELALQPAKPAANQSYPTKNENNDERQMVSDHVASYQVSDTPFSPFPVENKNMLSQRDFSGRWQDVIAIKEQLKSHPIDNVDNDIINALNAIELRDRLYPMLSIKQAAVLLSGTTTSLNHSRVVSQAREKQEIFAFRFSLDDNSKASEKLKVPAFQFDTQHSRVYPVIALLVKAMQGLNDHAVFNWLTTPLKKYQLSPAQMVSDTSKSAELVERASFYRAEHTQIENQLS